MRKCVQHYLLNYLLLLVFLLTENNLQLKKMYHKIEDQEKNPFKYVLAKIDPSMTQDECYDLFTKPRQTQKTIGLYLKEIKDPGHSSPSPDDPHSPPPPSAPIKKRFTLTPGCHGLEREVKRNKGLWVEKPQAAAPLTYKLKDAYTVDIPQKKKGGQGIFYRPHFLELDYVIKLANAGLLYSDEEVSDSEEEIQSDDTSCLPLRKTKYIICDPCKKKKEKKEAPEEQPPKNLIEEMRREGKRPPFKKIPSGCQCDFFGDHDQKQPVWDNPFKDRVDMLRQHEMDKVMRPYRREFLNKNYEKHPPVKFMAYEFGMKRTFPVFQISNL